MRQSPRDKPRLITDALLRRWPLPPLEGAGSKEARGRVLIIAGANEMPGAAILASTAALRAGAGKVRVATAKDVATRVATAVPELFVFKMSDRQAVIDSAHKADVVLIGSGVRNTKVIRALLPKLLRIETLRALIIDASALPLISGMKLHSRTILTPHAGEMGRLLHLSPGELECDSLGCARGLARRSGAIVVLKGAETLICEPAGNAYLNNRGHAGLATAGSGDILAGIIAGYSARGTPPLQAAVWGVSIHARAGERLAPIGFLARELADAVPRLTSEFTRR